MSSYSSDSYSGSSSSSRSNGRVPLDEWYSTVATPEQRVKWIQRQLAKETKRRSGGTKRKRGSTKKTTGTKRRRTSSSSSYGFGGTNIIYPNVIGRGRYYIGGGFGYNKAAGWHGGAKAYYTDEVAGLGEYTIKKNSLMSAIDMGMSPPMVRNSNHGEATVINHREYLGDLLSGSGTPTAFTLQSFNINPGNSELFPFLANIARNFQEYEVRGMIFELKTLSSDFSTSFSLGSMFMATDYNVLGPAPGSKQALENMEYASSSKPSTSIIMPVECDPRNSVDTHLYVAIDEDYQGGDPRLYDLGKVYIGSQGLPVPNSPIAEIWVTYEVALFKPILNGNMPNEETSSLHLIGTAGVTPTRPLGSTFEYSSSENWVVEDGGDSDQVVIWPPEETGHYLIWFQTNSTGTGVAPVMDNIITLFQGLDAYNVFGTGAGTNTMNEMLGLAGITDLNAYASYGWAVSKPNTGLASIKMGNIGSNFAVPAKSDLWIVKIAPDMTQRN